MRTTDNRDLEEMERYYQARIEALRQELKQKNLVIEALRDEVFERDHQLGMMYAQIGCQYGRLCRS